MTFSQEGMCSLLDITMILVNMILVNMICGPSKYYYLGIKRSKSGSGFVLLPLISARENVSLFI